MSNRISVRDLVISGLLLALGLIIPSIFHSTGISGKIFLPMHIPVLLGGFLLPPLFAMIVGIVTPIFSGLITGMPELFPMGVIMLFELGIYGLVASILYRKFRIPVIISLIVSMIIGRIVAGIVVFLLIVSSTVDMDPIIFVKSGIITGLPGIIIQLILIPILMYGINRYTTINLD
ncbi:MAG: ECF transporter S component [Tissierellaceae bacterium]